MTTGSPYVQSPIDDIESFFWVALWAVLFNKQVHNRVAVELEWREKLEHADPAFKALLLLELEEITQRQLDSTLFSSISRQLLPFLQAWLCKLRTLKAEWVEISDRAEDVQLSDLPDFYIKHFHVFALRGVKLVLGVLNEHLPRLRDCPSFSIPYLMLFARAA
jgi:hypothetical protein